MPIAEAIRTQHLLTFNYDGYMRTVEPHTYGTDRKGNRALRAYQVGGCWRRLNIDHPCRLNFDQGRDAVH